MRSPLCSARLPPPAADGRAFCASPHTSHVYTLSLFLFSVSFVFLALRRFLANGVKFTNPYGTPRAPLTSACLSLSVLIFVYSYTSAFFSLLLHTFFLLYLSDKTMPRKFVRLIALVFFFFFQNIFYIINTKIFYNIVFSVLIIIELYVHCILETNFKREINSRSLSCSFFFSLFLVCTQIIPARAFLDILPSVI